LWDISYRPQKVEKFVKQIYKEIQEEFNRVPSSSTNNSIHSQTIYTSRCLDFKNLPEPQNSQAINDQF